MPPMRLARRSGDSCVSTSQKSGTATDTEKDQLGRTWEFTHHSESHEQEPHHERVGEMRSHGTRELEALEM